MIARPIRPKPLIATRTTFASLLKVLTRILRASPAWFAVRVASLAPDPNSSALVRTKRIYDAPERGDGRRVLVERLWPRGMTKAALIADAWLKDVAPSTALRKWFGHREDRWREFRQRYRKELDANPERWRPLISANDRRTLTLLYSARDTRHNAAIVLREYLIERDPKRVKSFRLMHRRRRDG